MKLRVIKGFNYSQNGTGNRLVVYLQGCNMHCPWCANPESLPVQGVMMVHKELLLKLKAEGIYTAIELNDTHRPLAELRQYLSQCEKFGNNKKTVDEEAVVITKKISDMVRSRKNHIENGFRPEFSTPSIYLIYGSLVGALPSGKRAKEMLNYEVAPLYGEVRHGLGVRVLSTSKLPYEKFNGGYY